MIYVLVAFGLVSLASCILLIVVCMASAQSNRGIETERPIVQRMQAVSKSVTSPAQQP
jgi:hypothetical protein